MTTVALGEMNFYKNTVSDADGIVPNRFLQCHAPHWASLSLACALLPLFLVCSALAESTSGIARLVCADAVYNFGAMDNEKDPEHTFVLKNEGATPLKIDRMNGCCGVSLWLSQYTILPGSNATLKATLSLHGRSGPVQKSIYVQSNDPSNRIVQLQFVGNAIAAVDIQPGTVDFGAIDEDAKVEKTVTVVCQSNITFRVTNIVSMITNFHVAYAGMIGNTHRVVLKTIPTLPFGWVQGDVTLLTDNPKYSRLAIHLNARVTSDIVFVPSEILLTGVKDKPEPVTRYVALRSRSGVPFKILSIVPPSPDVSVSSVPLESGGYRMELKNILPMDDINNEKLVIMTDHKTAKQIAIPFRIVLTAGLPK